jgi:general stress protein 26
MERPLPSSHQIDDPAVRPDGSDHPLDELVNEGDVVMLTTVLRGHLTSRPLTVAGLGAGTLLFLVDSSADWVVALDAPAEVNASISTRGNDWVSVTGAATVTNDHEAIARLWSPAASAYFDGADDPRLRVLQLHMESGEYWSAPGTGPLGRLVSLVSAAVGSDVAAGERGRVTP